MARKQTKAPESPAREPIEATWRGEPVWRCPLCERDAQDVATIREHIERDHPLAQEASADGAADADENDGSGA